MMKKSNNIIQQSNIVLGSYYIGKLLHYVNMTIILYTLLSEAKYGLYRGIINAAFLLANLDLEEAVMKFYPSFKDDPKKKATFWTWSLLMNSLLFAVIILLFSLAQLVGKNSTAQSNIYHYYPLVFFMGYVIQLSKILKSWSMVLQQIAWPNILQNIVLELFIGSTLYAYYMGWLSSKALLLTMPLPYCLHLLLMIAYILYLGKVKIAFNFRYINQSFIRSFLTYALFVLIAGKVIILLMRIDSFLLGKLWGDQVVGKYMYIISVIVLLDIPYKVTRQSIGPLLANAFNQYQPQKISSLFRLAVMRQLLLASFVFLLLYYNRSYFLEIKNPYETTYILLLLGLAKVFDNFFSVGRTVLILSPHYKYSIVLSGLAVINIAINWYLISVWGLYGAAMSMLLTNIFLGSTAFYLVWYTMKIHPFSWKKWLAILTLALLIIIERWLPNNPSTPARALRLTIPCTVYGIFFLFRQYGSQLRQTKKS